MGVTTNKPSGVTPTMATTDKLTDTTIRKATPGEKPRKLSDGGGLYLDLRPNGARWWRLKYRMDGKEKLLGLGSIPPHRWHKRG